MTLEKPWRTMKKTLILPINLVNAPAAICLRRRILKRRVPRFRPRLELIRRNIRAYSTKPPIAVYAIIAYLMRPVLCYIVGIFIAIRAWKLSDPKSKMTVRISVKKSSTRLSWVVTNAYDMNIFERQYKTFA